MVEWKESLREDAKPEKTKAKNGKKKVSWKNMTGEEYIMWQNTQLNSPLGPILPGV